MKASQAVALRRLEKMIVRTPMLSGHKYENNGRSLSHLYFKDESSQKLRSYKLRGVVNALQTYLNQARHPLRELTTVSAGNMAQAVALAAAEFGIAAKIYVPDSAPAVKKSAIESFGAKIIEVPFQNIWQMVMFPEKMLSHLNEDQLLIHPVVTPGLNKGYESLASEILEDCPNIEYLVIPFGVGGLSLGLARYFKRQRPDVRLVLAEVETACPFYESLRRGQLVTVERKTSFVDAIGTPQCLPCVFDELRWLIDDVKVVSEWNALSALRRFHDTFGRLCEGAAAVSIAVAEALAITKPQSSIVAVVTGGNISSDILNLKI